MATINISLPEALVKFLKAQVKQHGYSTVSEYMRVLIRESKKRQSAQNSLDALLLEGLESGEGRVVDDGFWDEFHRKTETHRSSGKQ